MNTWTKQEIEQIAGQLQADKIVKIKDQIFIAASRASSDVVEVGFGDLAAASGGACVAKVSLGHVIQNLAADRPMGTILRNMMGEEQEAFIVVIAYGSLKDGKALFLMAHELGHIHYKHYEQCSQEEIEDPISWAEREADEYAAEVLGSQEPGQETFSFMVEKLNSFLPNAEGEQKVIVEKMLFAIETRMIWNS